MLLTQNLFNFFGNKINLTKIFLYLSICTIILSTLISTSNAYNDLNKVNFFN